MKLLSICLLAAAFLTLLSGCVTETETHRYTPGEDEKLDAQFRKHR